MELKRNDLMAAAKRMGLEVEKTDTAESLREKLTAALGSPDSSLDQAQQARVIDSTVRTLTQGADEIRETVAGKRAPRPRRGHIPNLLPNGEWQGKRIRLKRLKSGENDIGGAIFRWNGWPTIVPLDVEVDVAWPIFQAMRATRTNSVDVVQEEYEDAKGNKRVNNKKVLRPYDKYPVSVIGITPGTEDLPEDGLDYTLTQYAAGFPNFSLIMWRQMCTLWEIENEEAGVKPGMPPDKELEVRRAAVHYKLNMPMDDEELSDEENAEARRRFALSVRQSSGVGLSKQIPVAIAA